MRFSGISGDRGEAEGWASKLRSPGDLMGLTRSVKPLVILEIPGMIRLIWLWCGV
jgi:hypothetical protein